MTATLVRRLGLWSSIGLVIGITIGGGIFRTPASIAARVPDPMWMLGVWVLGGVIVLCGALAFAELSASMPETGGMYVYLREGWGRPYAFLYGWAQLVLIRAAALGGISSVFGEYFLRVVGIDPALHPDWADYLAAGAIVFAGIINIVGVQLGALFAGLSTIAKFGALSILVVASLLLGGGVGASWSNLASTGAPVDAGLFGLALISVMWAYDGFADLTFASGEVRDPQRNLPRAIVLGTVAIIAIYLLSNAAYLYISPIDRLQSSRLIAADTMSALFGQGGVAFVSVVVMISTFGSLMGSMVASPRIFFAMADDKLLFKSIAAVHPTWRTPWAAITLATRSRRGDGDDANVRTVDRYVRAGDVAVLCAERGGYLSAAQIASAPAAAVQSRRLPVRASRVHRSGLIPCRERAHHGSEVDVDHIRRRPGRPARLLLGVPGGAGRCGEDRIRVTPSRTFQPPPAPPLEHAGLTAVDDDGGAADPTRLW